jgi:hypothetical protein
MHEIKKYRIMYDDSYRMLRIDSGVKTISNEDPVLVATIISGKLRLFEADNMTNDAYKPAKQLVINYDGMELLYNLLAHILGEPIHMKFRYKDKEEEKEQQKEEPSNPMLKGSKKNKQALRLLGGI